MLRQLGPDFRLNAPSQTTVLLRSAWILEQNFGHCFVNVQGRDCKCSVWPIVFQCLCACALVLACVHPCMSTSVCAHVAAACDYAFHLKAATGLAAPGGGEAGAEGEETCRASASKNKCNPVQHGSEAGTSPGSPPCSCAVPT